MAPVSFRYLSEPDMEAAGVMDMAACIDTMDDVFRLLESGDYRMPGLRNNQHGAFLMFPDEPRFPGMPGNAPDRRFMAMPAYLGGRFNATGVKWYGSNPENRTHGLPRSILLYILNDTESGVPKAIMSANLLSAMRTGAVPGLGARHFAPREARTVSVIGPGVMNRTALVAFMAVRPTIDTVIICGRARETIRSYEQFVIDRFPFVRTLVADSLEEAVRGGDIVSIATSAQRIRGSKGYPCLKRAWVRPGAYVSLASEVMIDEALYADDVLKIVDFRGMYEAVAEEFPAPYHEHVGNLGVYFMDLIESGRLDSGAIVELGTVLSGTHPGRTSDGEIVLASIGGLAVEDVAWAVDTYDNAVSSGIGTELLLWDSPALA